MELEGDYVSLRQQARLSIFTALSSGRKKCNVRARESLYLVASRVGTQSPPDSMDR